MAVRSAFAAADVDDVGAFLHGQLYGARQVELGYAPLLGVFEHGEDQSPAAWGDSCDGAVRLAEEQARYVGAVYGHRARAGGVLYEGVQPCEVGTREAGVGEVHRSVEHGDAHLGVAEEFLLLSDPVQHGPDVHDMLPSVFPGSGRRSPFGVCGTGRDGLLMFAGRAGMVLWCLALAASIRVDLHLVQDAARQVIAGRSPLLADSDHLIGDLSRELLPGWAEEWLLLERERWDQTRVYALEGLAQQFQGADQYLPALQAALAAIAIDPFRETPYRIAIEVHIAEGNVASAIKRYQEYRAFLHREMRVAPSRQMAQMIRDLMPT